MQTKEERATYMKKWYEAHKEEKSAYGKKRREHLRDQWMVFMQADKLKCSSCGYNKCFIALEQHHNDPTEKDFSIGNFMKRAFNEKNQKIMLRELGKCICMCANCHAKFHDLQRKLKDETEKSKEDQS